MALRPLLSVALPQCKREARLREEVGFSPGPADDIFGSAKAYVVEGIWAGGLDTSAGRFGSINLNAEPFQARPGQMPANGRGRVCRGARLVSTIWGRIPVPK